MFPKCSNFSEPWMVCRGERWSFLFLVLDVKLALFRNLEKNMNLSKNYGDFASK